jgi:hypothetical protein
MAYSFQTFSVNQILTSTEMNQVEINIRDHSHGGAGVNQTLGAAPTASGHYANAGYVNQHAVYSNFYTPGSTVNSGGSLRGLANLDSTLGSIVVPSGKSLRLLRATGWIVTAGGAASYSAAWEFFNITDSAATTLYSMAAVTASTNASFVLSGTVDAPIASLGDTHAWQLRFSALAAPSGYPNGNQHCSITYTYV